nr:immunoglobulin light chain junction region [Macaca mulatta]MOV72089.1 immunoglobulin light chain junction region [Macaca mulatta]MOV72171.1 immunoglobulin light chain junction region [Macaca mulatta]MOV72236.1 immunoglobulin light chain junction region [Macaca mulatta]MOV72286.1 immunoglobulin light chain junction region [Macaca mulatta]
DYYCYSTDNSDTHRGFF